MIRFRREASDGEDHGCQGDFGKEVCCAAERRGTRATRNADKQGKSAVQRLLKARILLKADISEAGEGWSDNRIIKALETSASMVYRTLVEEIAAWEQDRNANHTKANWQFSTQMPV